MEKRERDWETSRGNALFLGARILANTKRLNVMIECL